jgi:hypothetical protein
MKKGQHAALVLSEVVNAPSQAQGVRGTNPGVLLLIIPVSQYRVKMPAWLSKMATRLLSVP